MKNKHFHVISGDRHSRNKALSVKIFYKTRHQICSCIFWLKQMEYPGDKNNDININMFGISTKYHKVTFTQSFILFQIPRLQYIPNQLWICVQNCMVAWLASKLCSATRRWILNYAWRNWAVHTDQCQCRYLALRHRSWFQFQPCVTDHNLGASAAILDTYPQL